MFETKCSCGATLPATARFCSACGAQTGSRPTGCASCGAALRPGAKFCGNCGATVTGAAPGPPAPASGWSKRADQFAVRVDIADMEGFFRKGVRVEHGTRGLVFIDGAYVGALDPGWHEIPARDFSGTWWQRIVGRRVQGFVVLTNIADQELSFSCGGLRCADALALDVGGSIVVRVGDPNLFYVNRLLRQPALDLADLHRWLQDELANALGEVVASRQSEELRSNAASKRQFEEVLEDHLRRSFARSGLEFVQLRNVSFLSPELEEIRDGRAANVVMGKEADVHSERAAVLGRLLNALNSEKMADLRSTDQLAAFVLEQDKGRILRDEELADLVRMLQERREDHAGARAHVQSLLDVEREIEVRRRRTGMGEVERAELDHEIELEKLRRGAMREDEHADFQQSLQQGVAQSKARNEELASKYDLLKRMKDDKLGRSRTVAQDDHQRRMEELAKKSELPEDKLLIIAAQENANVAAALTEKFSAERAREEAVKAEQREREERERLDRAKREDLDRMERVMSMAMGTQRDTAVAAATGRTPPTQPGQAWGTPSHVICRRCSTTIELRPMLKFCPNCGEPIS